MLINYPIIYTNFINPIFWSIILLYLLIYSKLRYIKSNSNPKLISYMIIILSMYVIFYFYLGFFLGFCKSPYSHNFFTLLRNIITIIFPVIGIEIFRGVIICQNKGNKFIAIFITILLILVGIKYNTLINLFPNRKNLFIYICSEIIPFISCNLLCTYLSSNSTLIISLLYRIVSESVILLLPILPNINWFLKGAIYILYQVLIYVMYKYVFFTNLKIKSKGTNYLIDKISYFITLSLSIALVLFMIGAFKYEPIAILSNSMSPTFNRGDIVIYKKLSEKELNEIQENEIIIYSYANQNISHRVIKKVKTPTSTLYITKGDNNNVADHAIIKTSQIKGVYTFNIKYLGFPSVWLYDYFHN